MTYRYLRCNFCNRLLAKGCGSVEIKCPAAKPSTHSIKFIERQERHIFNRASSKNAEMKGKYGCKSAINTYRRQPLCRHRRIRFGIRASGIRHSLASRNQPRFPRRARRQVPPRKAIHRRAHLPARLVAHRHHCRRFPLPRRQPCRKKTRPCRPADRLILRCPQHRGQP